MNTSAYNLYALLQNTNAISVPNYQRAYSWTTKNVEVLINDLNELGDRTYYYGHFQFEDQQNETFLVLDGQQRLTTLFLMYLAYNHLGGKEYGDLFNNQEKQLKFETVDYDRECFNKIISLELNETKTQSQARLNEVYKMLIELPVDKLEYYIQRLLISTVTTDTVLSKYEAVQRFALQNDRGVRATELDVIKADLMLYVYKHEHDTVKAEEVTERIQSCFSKIYENIEKIDIIHSEVQMLKYVACAYYEISLDSDIVVELRNLVNNNDYQLGGQDFVLELADKLELGFKILYKIQVLSDDLNCMVGDALLIEFKQAILLLLLTIEKLVPADSTDFSEINKILKHFVFIYYRINAYGVYSSADDMLIVAKEFLNNGNQAEALVVLDSRLKVYAQNSYRGWRNKNENLWGGLYILYMIEGLNHYGVSKFKKNATYVLWKYKNLGREVGSEEMASYYKSFANKSNAESLTIDHILPRNPQVDYNNEEVDKYMDSLGNLCLKSRSDNSSKGNYVPDDVDKIIEDVKWRNESIKIFIKETMFYEGELNYVTDWLSKNKA